MTGTVQEYRCARCGHTILRLTEHIRMTIQMVSGLLDVRRYCMTCALDPALAVLFSDLRNNPVKRIELFVVVR